MNPGKRIPAGKLGLYKWRSFCHGKKIRHSYGSDKNILGTDAHPIYATQRKEIRQFRFDVPEGNYELILHFAELLSNIKREELVYNLNGGDVTGGDFKERVFDVNINDVAFLKNIKQ